MKDLSDLPPAARLAHGRQPDVTPRYGILLAQAWYDQYVADGFTTKDHAVEGTAFRNSSAGVCTRALGYDTFITQEEVSNPPTMADSWRFFLGQAVHEMLQEKLQVAYGPGAEVEVKVDMRPFGLNSSGHIDAVVRTPTGEILASHDDTGDVLEMRTVAIEYKTINGFGFKMAVGARGDAEGPRTSAVLQGALNALAVDADELVIVYCSLELLSPREFDKIGGGPEHLRFMAEWTYTKDEYVPLAEAEIRRMQKVLAYSDQGLLPPRMIPGLPAGARVSDPKKGAWTVVVDNQIKDAGTTWHCGYCRHQDRCIADGGPGVVKITDDPAEGEPAERELPTEEP